MPLVGFQYGATTLTFAEAERQAEEGSFPYPVPLIRALAEDRGNETPSASSIAGCLRRFALKRRVDYHMKPTSGLPALFGTAFHSLMEQHTETDSEHHKELRLSATVDLPTGPVEMRGQLDYLHEGVGLRDWKTRVHIPQNFSPPHDHKAQVNVYNWLAWRNGLRPAHSYELVYVSQSWLARFTGAMASLTATEGWLTKRLSAWAEAEAAGELPPPVPELFQVDAKQRPVAPCAYCEVRAACLARLDKGSSPFAEVGE